jgi:glycosyltransferase involved in cell wall biosynthesis
MRIGFEAKRAFHNFVGLGNYARTLIEGLLKFYPEDQYVLYTPPFEDHRAKEWLGNLTQRPDVRLPRGLVGMLSSSAWRSIFLTNTVKKDNLNIFHGLSHELPPKIERINLKKVVTVHDLIFLRFPDYFSRIDRYIYQKKFTFSCQVADLVLAISEHTKNDIIELLKVPAEKIEVVYQSCSPQFYEMVPLAEREKIRRQYHLPYKYILYVGSFTKRKNLPTLVKAFAHCQKVNDIPLVLVGKGEEIKDQILELARSLNVERRIFFMPDVPTHHLPALYQSATVFVYPSFFEGFGIPILEAIFSQIPVITSTGSCFQEAGGPGTIYVDPNDDAAMGKALIDVLESEAVQKRMIDAGKNFIQKFHYQNTTQKLMQTYSRLLNS